jgi:Holliday junction DNA helicase RuvA
MIAFIEGVLEESLPTHVTLNANGVGYHVLIPLSSYSRLPQPGQRCRLLTHLQIREDAHVLYGFHSREERDLFRLLVGQVSGVGPKTALDVLSGMSSVAFKAAVASNDARALSQVKGIGKKTAERIIVELRDKVGIAAQWESNSEKHAPSPADAALNDAVLALIALGYKQVDAHKCVSTILAKSPSDRPAPTTDELVREALRNLL